MFKIKVNKIFFIVGMFFLSESYMSQSGIVKGRVFDQMNNEEIPFANIYIEELEIGTATDLDGNYEIKEIKPGLYNILFTFIGYESTRKAEVIVSSTKPTILNIGLLEMSTNLDEVEIKASPFEKSEESPVSKRNISATEIYRNPGGNRDISKVIQSLPGVASTVAFRNDIIIRGGAPNENRFYLDGIEVPNINHFATQGSSGGPVGMINVNFIREVDLYSGAFPANRGNSLSSIMEFKQIDGNTDRIASTFTIGSSDIGMTIDGPMGKKSTFVFSARRSYLQFLFKAIQLPFLPTYNDFQYKQSININNKNKITLIGLGAIDDFELNLGLNDNVTDQDTYERNEYILGYLPVTTQWNYTVGAKWTHFKENSFQDLVISRNQLNNSSVKYAGNIETPENLLQDYNSQEIENKIRWENTYRKNGWKINYGIGYEYVEYTNSTFQKISINDTSITINFNSALNFSKFNLFAQSSKKLFNDRLILSLGIRTDNNTYSEKMLNPFSQISPRFSFSYALNKQFSLNFNTGKYFQLPAYTVLGYRDANNNLINKENEISYISNDHVVAGIEYSPGNSNKITIEGAVYRPGKYEFTPGLTVKDLISKAAGINDRAFLERGLLFSTDDGVTETATPFSVSDVLSGSKDIQLQPDDRVRIFNKYDLAESYTLTIDGAVNQPVSIPYVENMTVEDLVLLGGGFTDSANENKIDIYRRVDDDSYETLSKNFKVSANGELTLEDGSNFILQPNDRVSVRYLKGFSEQIKVSVTGEANYPGNYTIESKNEKISDLLERAGGVTQYAFVEGATLVRLNPFYNDGSQKETFEGLIEKEEVTGKEDSTNVEEETLKNRKEFRVGINLQKIIKDNDSKHNLVLKSGDRLIIPSTRQTVKVQGEVLVPSLVRFEKGMTLKDYISKSGGFSSDAKKGKTYVVYANGDIASTKHFLFFRSFPKLEPGAAILVPAKPENGNKLSAQEVVGISTGLTTLGLLIDRLLQ